MKSPKNSSWNKRTPLKIFKDQKGKDSAKIPSLFLFFLYVSAFCFIGRAFPAEPANQQKLETYHASFSYGRYEIGDARFKKVYKEGREIYTLAIQGIFLRGEPHTFGLSFGLSSFEKKGRSTVSQESAKMTLVPLTFEFRYFLALKYLTPWAGAGLDYIRYNEESSLKSSSGGAFGYHVQAGLFFPIPKFHALKIKVYIKHSKAVTEQNQIKVDLGGFEYGIGLAFGFNI